MRLGTQLVARECADRMRGYLSQKAFGDLFALLTDSYWGGGVKSCKHLCHLIEDSEKYQGKKSPLVSVSRDNSWSRVSAGAHKSTLSFQGACKVQTDAWLIALCQAPEPETPRGLGIRGTGSLSKLSQQRLPGFLEVSGRLPGREPTTRRADPGGRPGGAAST